MASDMESGLEKPVRSTNSDHGRRAAKPVRTVSEMLVINARKAGVATGAWDSEEPPLAVVVDWGFDIGSIAGCDWEAISNN